MTQVSAAISGHTSTSASTTGGKGIYRYTTLPTTLGTTSDDGATTTASQDSTIAVQQPTIDNQYPLLDEGTLL